MGKTALLFPGQGSQKVGMGAGLAEERPKLFSRYVDAAGEASGLPIRRLCLEGPIEELTRTEAAQPALFAVCAALAEAAREAGLRPGLVAGHSLGEYTAAVASGALSVEDGTRLVARRGRLMAEIQSERPGAMAAVIGLDEAAVRELCERASEAGTVAPANLNSPTQIVCSGEETAIERLVALAEQAGARKALRLQVGAAFHSELMEPVQRELAAEMETIDWSDPDVPMVSNASGGIVRTADEVREALIAQIASPVLWADCVRTMLAEGCEEFVELGPGRVLGGLVRQSAPQARTHAVDSPEGLAPLVEAAAQAPGA